jgi:hypothetical protein
MYPSLIMIDEVPYFDLHALMSLPSAAIERIDVVNDVYLKGGIKFGGIINFRTREGDLTGIALPENAFFFDYQVFRPRTAPEMRGISFSRMPDTRNTIYWIPELEVSSHTPVQINFPVPEYPGIYSVLYRNISEDGGLRRAETFFQVR